MKMSGRKKILNSRKGMKKMGERKFRKVQQKIVAFLMALIMVVTSVGIIPIRADAAGRKIVKKLSVAQTLLELEEGEKESIKYKVTATKGTSKKIKIKISNKKVISAKVSGKKIVVKAKKEGKSTITVMTRAKNKRGKRIAKKIRVVVENFDEDELDYDFEDTEAYEEDEAEESTENVTTEKMVMTEESEETTEQESITEAPTATEETTGQDATTETQAAPEETREEAASTKKQETFVPSISYQVHMEDTGWMSNVKDGAVAGITGKSKQLEALKIILNSPDGKNMISYRAHVENVGWQNWVNSGQVAGTTAQTKAIEAVQIKLNDTYAQQYDVYYRVHVAYKGWLGWAKNGETAGSTGIALRTEAIQIKLVKKGTLVQTGISPSLKKPTLSYKAHVEDTGWQSAVNEEATAGTTGKSLRLEALQINLKNFDGGNGITYRAHVSDVGWQGWKTSGQTAGTTGQKKAIEAMEIKLDGSLGNFFDIYYRMHVADKGWLGWAKNGETAGTTGGGVKAEAIQIKLVHKKDMVNQNGAPYIDLTATNVVAIAASQVGYHEKASNYNLDDFTANSGFANYTKYARDIGVTNGQPWCTTFLLWCMKKAGVSSASYPYTTWVPTMKNWFNQRGLFRARGTYIPKAGDFIIFGNSGSHVGMVESVSNGYVHTIEGNTSSGTVKRNSYPLYDPYISGYGIVNYK